MVRSYHYGVEVVVDARSVLQGGDWGFLVHAWESMMETSTTNIHTDYTPYGVHVRSEVREGVAHEHPCVSAPSSADERA